MTNIAAVRDRDSPTEGMKKTIALALSGILRLGLGTEAPLELQ